MDGCQSGLLQTFVEEAISKYIIGQNSFDTCDADFISMLENMGVQRRTDLWQQAYDRYMEIHLGTEKHEAADRSRFLIVADHKLAEAEENSAQETDLALSGHAHAGQL